MDLKNKYIIVTGASSGIGQELAKILITKYNCRILGVARNTDKLLEFKQSLGERAALFDTYTMDVSLNENWQKLLEFVKANNINVDMLINNAGIMPPFKSADRLSTQEYENVMQVNYFSVVYGCKTFMPLLIKNKGAIVNISSLAAICCLPGISAYAASKAAIKSFSEGLACELRGHVKVYTVMPGFVKTNLLSGGTIHADDTKLINHVAAPVQRTAKKIIGKIKRNRYRTILGKDAAFMSLLYRWFPRSSGNTIGKFFRATKIKTMQNIYPDFEEYE